MNNDELDGSLLPDPDAAPIPAPPVEPDEDDDDDEEEEGDPDVKAPLRTDARGRPVVTIGGVDVVLGVPRSPTLVMEAVALVGTAPLRGYAACLATCWLAGGSPNAPRIKLERCGYHTAVWGGKVYDELVGRGLPPNELMAAGTAAFRLLVRHTVSGADIKAAKGF